MSTITLPNIRVSSDLTVKLKLKDGGVALDWSTLQNIKVSIYSDAQRALAGRCGASIDAEDPTLLVCTYAANKPQYVGVNRVVVSAKYMGETKTYDKPAFNFVRWTDDQAGEQITIEDPDIDVEISVEDVSSSILQEAVDAAFTAAEKAEEAAALIPLQVLQDCVEATEDANEAAEAANAAGITSVEASVADNEPGTPSVEATLLNKILTLVFHHLKGAKGDTGATPNITVGTVTTGEPGTAVVVTMTGTAESPVLNITIPQGLKGDQGNTGSSVDYPFELVNNLTTNDATKGLSAAQGYVLDGKIEDMVAYSERNYYNGKSLNYDGTFRSDLMDFCVTDKIPVKTGDTVYWRHNAPANASRLVLVVFNSDGNRITYWTGTKSYARTITIEQENAAYIMCSFPFAQFANAYVNVNGVRAYTPSEQSSGTVTDLRLCRDAQLCGGKHAKKINPVWNSGQYFNTSGEKGESANYGYSDPIKLSPGVGIMLEVPAYRTVSVISLTNELGDFVSSEVVGVDSESVMEYSYVNESSEDVYVVLSGIIIYNPWAAYVYDYSGTKKNDDGADVVFEGVFHGNDNSFVSLSFPVRAGDYLHLGFPDGDWVTNRHAYNYTKISFAQVDANGASVGTTTLAYESWEVPDYGYDIYVSPQSASGVAVASVIVYIRAKKDVDVPMVVTRLSKETIKPYFELEMTDTIRKVRAFQTNPCLTLALCTDLHYRDIDDGTVPFAPYSPLGMCLNIAELSKRIRIDNVVCMGDQIDGWWSAEWAQRDSSDIVSFFNKAKAPLLDTIGNHDDNRYFANGSGDRKLTPGEQFSYFIQPVDERAVLSDTMNGCNYYRDVERHKIRIISPIGVNLNGGYAYTNDTISWFTDVLDSMPQGYKAMVFTHEHFLGAQGWSDNITGGSRMAEVIASKLDKVICVFFGHTHIDNVWLSPYIGINVAAQKVYNAASESVDGKNNPMGESAPEDSWWPLRAVGDARENLWDVVSVDTFNSVISCIRFGAGVDRFIHYAPVSVAAGGSITLTPSFVTATSWHVRASESASIGISDGVVTVDSSAVSGSRLTARAEDADGNYEYWIVKVVTE